MIESCNCEQCDLKNLLFLNISEKEKEDLCANKFEREFKKGEIIIEAGKTIKDFIYLKEGLVKLYRDSVDDKEQIITIAGPLDFVSLLSVFSGKKYNYSVMSPVDSTTCNLKFSMVKKLINTNGPFTSNL